MIGVIADSSEHDVVREFFELFKTPWEFCRRERQYEVVLCAGHDQFDGNSKLLLLYAGRKTYLEDEPNVQTRCQLKDSCILLYRGDRLPIYGDTVAFPEKGSILLTDEDSHECIAYLDPSGERVLARIGYDLFGEIRKLLTVGQPAKNASMPALDLHIALLRDLIISCGVCLVEIPPVPDGYNFIACLTHDVDHPSIRQHKWDHTMFGFLYRAFFGSVRNLIRGRISARNLVRNWAAALKLPFVLLGAAKDFWREFADRYLELENGLHSTYFMIPFNNYPGRNTKGPAPTARAAHYDVKDLANTIRKLLAAGCEVGLHGIDAWLDGTRGSLEIAQIQRLTGTSEIGVRMHWLYYDHQDSPAELEKAGAAFDSTVGYNETVGYRAGTTQAYKPLQATWLLELPLHVMDTALFYPAYLDVSPRQADNILRRMVDRAVQFGGCLTVNWHDRSMAPERLWNLCYRDLLRNLQSRGAWFSTVGQAVSWFRKRRSVVFDNDASGLVSVRGRMEAQYGNNSLPGMRLRIHKASAFGNKLHASENYVDIGFNESVDVPVPGEVRQ